MYRFWWFFLVGRTSSSIRVSVLSVSSLQSELFSKSAFPKLERSVEMT